MSENLGYLEVAALSSRAHRTHQAKARFHSLCFSALGEPGNVVCKTGLYFRTRVGSLFAAGAVMGEVRSTVAGIWIALYLFSLSLCVCVLFTSHLRMGESCDVYFWQLQSVVTNGATKEGCGALCKSWDLKVTRS